MADQSPTLFREFDEDDALRRIVEGTASQTAERFFLALVENLARVLDVHGAWVTEYLEDAGRLRAFAFWLDGRWLKDYEYDIAGSPCETVVREVRLVHIPDRVIEVYPRDPDLKKLGALSYMGAPLLDGQDRVIGHLAVLDKRPMPREPRAEALIQIFAARAAAELRRMLVEGELKGREEQFRSLIDGVMDAIVLLDRDLRVARMNPAAEKAFRCSAAEASGHDIGRFLSPPSRERLTALARDLGSSPLGTTGSWIAGGLESRRADGSRFPAEATLSRVETSEGSFTALIFRDVNDRQRAEETILSLSQEAERLREEIRAIGGSGEILGRSPAMSRVLEDIRMVAPTGAAVLILGETGTGKEIVARAIHSASPRREKPLVSINCGAIPSGLVESELFGHEKGAFTGAMDRREGRFSLADGGTIFLDEVGELPLEIQVKLLRVLQEGEFEAVGSPRTRKVDVRVLAATNRELSREVKEGKFREDLYYRLNVFPISLPPLRDRREDIPLLAESFVLRITAKMGIRVEPLGPADLRLLDGYDWPGNIRELQNVLERAIITSRDGRLNLNRALPGALITRGHQSGPGDLGRILTEGEFAEVERRNLVLALETAGWRISGDEGAARLLGMNPSTLRSRMKALGVRRPR